MVHAPHLPVAPARFEELFARVRDACLERFGPDLVALVVYGSAARGKVREYSDLDLLVVARGLPAEHGERNRIGGEIDRALRPRLEEFAAQTGWNPYLSFLFRTPEEANRVSRFYFDMTEEARLLVDRDDFFRGVLDQVSERLRRAGARRVTVGKRWYWDLKPDWKPGDRVEI
jgi:predicted nucleotidyltransferase